MNRRQLISNLLYSTGGIILADKLELIERLTPKNYVNGIELFQRGYILFDKQFNLGFIITSKAISYDYYGGVTIPKMPYLKDKFNLT